MSRLVLWICLLMSHQLMAHPTSFKGSWIIESKFSEPMTEIGLGYGLSSRYALWVKTMGFPMANQEKIGLVQMNHLLKRWNAPESQGNLYVGLGGGRSYYSNQPQLNQASLGLGFIQADWETRYIYIMADHQTFSPGAPHHRISRLRVGLAPYIADFDQQSAWMIGEFVQFDNLPLDVRAILRLYHKNILYEIGGSLNGSAIINLMTHL